MSKNPLYAVNVCGLRPDAEFVNSIAANNIATVHTQQPTLKWEAFPREEDRGAETPVSALQATDITYELRLWKRDPDGNLQDVLSVPDLKEPSYQVPQPLEWDAIYGWSVRARFRTLGQVRTTDWTLLHSQADILRLASPPPFACPDLPEGRTNSRRVFEFIPNRP